MDELSKVVYVLFIVKKNIQEHLNDLAGWTKYKKGLCETCAGLDRKSVV